MFSRQNKSLAGILSSFHKNIEELENLSKTNQDSAASKLIAAKDLENSAKALKKEGDDAQRIADKIKELVS